MGKGFGMTAEQLRIRFGALVDSEALYQEVLRAIEALASGLGKGAVADQLQMPDATFSHALRDRNRCHFKAAHLVALILLDEGDAILELLARAKGKTLHRKRQRTDAESLELLKSFLRKRLGELGEEITREALR